MLIDHHKLVVDECLTMWAARGKRTWVTGKARPNASKPGKTPTTSGTASRRGCKGGLILPFCKKNAYSLSSGETEGVCGPCVRLCADARATHAPGIAWTNHMSLAINLDHVVAVYALGRMALGVQRGNLLHRRCIKSKKALTIKTNASRLSKWARCTP